MGPSEAMAEERGQGGERQGGKARQKGAFMTLVRKLVLRKDKKKRTGQGGQGEVSWGQ